MKKIAVITFTMIVALILIYLVSSGFRKETSAFIGEYSISEDGKEITMDIGVGSSIGYVRKAKIHKQEGGKLYMDCYSAFGGINGSIGAKKSFTLPLNEDTTIIAIYRNRNCYEEVLRKDADGVWRRIK
mgnify:CR=1 FL=1